MPKPEIQSFGWQVAVKIILKCYATARMQELAKFTVWIWVITHTSYHTQRLARSSRSRALLLLCNRWESDLAEVYAARIGRAQDGQVLDTGIIATAWRIA